MKRALRRCAEKVARRTILQSALPSAALPFLLGRQVSALPVRLRRKDCYFGLHFDLHPNQHDTVLGRDVSDQMVDNLLTRVKPDFVQYDCKGHPGYLGYQSKVSTPAPGIIHDSLETWRRATALHGSQSSSHNPVHARIELFNCKRLGQAG